MNDAELSLAPRSALRDEVPRPAPQILVSFILASNKPEYFAGMCENFEETARNPAEIEIVVYVDDGDEKMARCLEEQRRIRPFAIKALAAPPAGYYNLWKGINRLHALCDPRAYFVNNVNDEIRFETPHWDERLRRYIGFFPDDVFRLRLSIYKLRNYRDFWECGYAPENYAFYTKAWIDLQGDWNACHGPDAFQQMVAYRLHNARYPEKAQHNRDIVIWDIAISGEGVNIAISDEELERRVRGGWRTWWILVSHRMQEEANRRACHIQGYIEARGAGHNPSDFKLVDMPRRRRVEVRHVISGEVLHDSRWRPLSYSYRLKKLPVVWTNLKRRPFKHYYCGGEKGFTAMLLKDRTHKVLIKTLLRLSPITVRKMKELVIDYLWRLPLLSGPATGVATHQVQWSRAWHLSSRDFHPWDSGSPVEEDTYFWLSWRQRIRPRLLAIVTHNPGGQSFVRDVSVVVRTRGLLRRSGWVIVPARIHGEAEFREKLTIPECPDMTQIVIQPDPAVMRAHRVYDIGLACFSKSRGDKRNYVEGTDSIIVRRMVTPE